MGSRKGAAVKPASSYFSRGYARHGKAGVRSAHRLLLSLVVAVASCVYQSAADADRQVVRMMLQAISLDSLCGCEHIVIDPTVKRSQRLINTPTAPRDRLFELTDDDLQLIRGARTVMAVSGAEWPYFERELVDTMALAVFVVDTARLRDADARTVALFVMTPSVSMQIWTYTAWRCDGKWRGGPLVLTAQP